MKASVDLNQRTGRTLDEVNRTLIEVRYPTALKQGEADVSDINPSSEQNSLLVSYSGEHTSIKSLLIPPIILSLNCLVWVPLLIQLDTLRLVLRQQGVVSQRALSFGWTLSLMSLLLALFNGL